MEGSGEKERGGGDGDGESKEIKMSGVRAEEVKKKEDRLQSKAREGKGKGRARLCTARESRHNQSTQRITFFDILFVLTQRTQPTIKNEKKKRKTVNSAANELARKKSGHRIVH